MPLRRISFPQASNRLYILFVKLNFKHMQKKFVLVAVMALVGLTSAKAQNGDGQGRQRLTIEERVKMIMDKLVDFKLSSTAAAQADSAFTQQFKAQAKLREGLQPGERPNREEIQKLITERDDKLKKIFTEDQFKKWKDEIEPSLRPQRRGDGNGPPPGGGQQ
jgi:periplasmic protein CpxP/Spy